jgi:hypothetical protein
MARWGMGGFAANDSLRCGLCLGQFRVAQSSPRNSRSQRRHHLEILLRSPARRSRRAPRLAVATPIHLRLACDGGRYAPLRRRFAPPRQLIHRVDIPAFPAPEEGQHNLAQYGTGARVKRAEVECWVRLENDPPERSRLLDGRKEGGCVRALAGADPQTFRGTQPFLPNRKIRTPPRNPLTPVAD